MIESIKDGEEIVNITSIMKEKTNMQPPTRLQKILNSFNDLFMTENQSIPAPRNLQISINTNERSLFFRNPSKISPMDVGCTETTKNC